MPLRDTPLDGSLWLRAESNCRACPDWSHSRHPLRSPAQPGSRRGQSPTVYARALRMLPGSLSLAAGSRLRCGRADFCLWFLREEPKWCLTILPRQISANPLRISHCRQISAKALRISQPENREGRTFSFFQGYQRSIPVRTVQLVSAINRSVSSYRIRLGVCLPALPRQSAARSRSWYRLVRHWQPLQSSAAQPL